MTTPGQYSRAARHLEAAREHLRFAEHYMSEDAAMVADMAMLQDELAASQACACIRAVEIHPLAAEPPSTAPILPETGVTHRL